MLGKALLNHSPIRVPSILTKISHNNGWSPKQSMLTSIKLGTHQPCTYLHRCQHPHQPHIRLLSTELIDILGLISLFLGPRATWASVWIKGVGRWFLSK
jgi:hypothetical protein